MDAHLVGHSHELGEGASPHLSHDLAAMDGNGDFARAELGGGLLVQKATDHEWQYLALSRSQTLVVPLELREARPHVTPRSVE